MAEQTRSGNKTGNRGQGPKDANQLAFAVVQRAIGAVKDEPVEETQAVTLGRMGGLKGGKARASKLSPQRRAEIAKKAATTRWGEQPPNR